MNQFKLQSLLTSIDRRKLLSYVWQIGVFLLIVYFIYAQRQDVRNAIDVLRTTPVRWLLILTGSAIFLHACMTQALSEVLRRLGSRIPFPDAFLTHAEREMIAAIMPIGGIASFAVLNRRFRRYGVTPVTAGLGTLLYSVVGHTSFLVLVIPTLLWLAVTQSTSSMVWIGFAIVIVSVLAVAWLATAVMRGQHLPSPIERRLPESLQSLRSEATSYSVRPIELVPAFVLSLFGDLAGALCVWIALHAVGEPASFMVALSAYVVGTLLMLAAPVFQGIGLVEVSMTLVLQQFGVPTAHALAATLLYRLVEIWFPILLGIGAQARDRPRLRNLPAVLPALWTGFNGLILLISALPHPLHVVHAARQPRRDNDLTGWVLLHPGHLNHTIQLAGGLVLFLIAIRLLQRQHSAWVVAIGLSILLTIERFTAPHDQLSGLLTLSNVALLLLYRDRFRVRTDIPSLRRGITTFLAAGIAVWGYATISLYLVDRRVFGKEFSFHDAVVSALRALTWFGDDLDVTNPTAKWIQSSFHVITAVALLISAWAILRPIIWRRKTHDADTRRAAAFIARFGDSSLDRFKYWPDKHQFFADESAGVVSFGVAHRVALALGDPVAPDPVGFDQTLTEYLEFCRINACTPAFHQVPPKHLTSYATQKLEAIGIGQEAIIDLQDFSMTGSSMKNLRTLWNKAARTDTTPVRHNPPHSEALLADLREVSNQWLTLEGRRERTFTLGQYSDAYLQECPLIVYRSAEGRAEAFINLIPDGSPGEATFDLMRHRPDAPNGAMDLLMLALIEDARANGQEHVSLGMVPFVGAAEAEGNELVDQAVARLSGPMGHYFASDSLYRYKDKFHPRWEPRYLIVPSLAALPRVSLALVDVSELPENQESPWHRMINSLRHRS